MPTPVAHEASPVDPGFVVTARLVELVDHFRFVGGVAQGEDLPIGGSSKRTVRDSVITPQGVFNAFGELEGRRLSWPDQQTKYKSALHEAGTVAHNFQGVK